MFSSEAKGFTGRVSPPNAGSETEPTILCPLIFDLYTGTIYSFSYLSLQFTDALLTGVLLSSVRAEKLFPSEGGEGGVTMIVGLFTCCALVGVGGVMIIAGIPRYRT